VMVAVAPLEGAVHEDEMPLQAVGILHGIHGVRVVPRAMIDPTT
jgi:hypothetical protein